MFAVLLAAGLGGGCALQDGSNGGALDQAPATFTSDRELETYLKEQLARSLVPEYLDGGVRETTATTDAGSAPGAGASEVSGYSGTNLQEIGVDESDTVKTDGHTLFVAVDEAVQVVGIDAESDGALSLLSRVPVAGRVDSLYLRNGLLAVLYTPPAEGDEYWGGAVAPALPNVMVGMPYWLPVAAQTGVLLVDVTDPAAPAPVRDWTFDGTLVLSRLLGSRLHLVQQFLPRLPPLEIRYGAEDQREPIAQANLAQLEPLGLDDLLPGYSVRDGAGTLLTQGRLVATADFLRPPEPSGGSIVAVVTLDLDAPAAPQRSVGAVLDAHHVYASTTALYLAAQRWQPGPAADAGSGGVRTAVHGFDLTGETLRYLGSAAVPGAVLNQFSFGEYRGVLRVATTSGWGTGARNHVFCLRPVDERLVVVGSLENLAPGESLYAARFLGPRGFLVTFVKVDPLITLDLADPTAPRVVGELKVPGYSEYLHPLGENHLLAVGKGAKVQDGTVWYQGLQLSVFDVTEFANPKLLYRHELGDRGSESEVLYNHKAFTYWDADGRTPDGLLALPVQLREHPVSPQNPWDYGTPTFTGVEVLRVGLEAGFTEVGRLATAEPAGWWGWSRGIFIGDRVYAVTSNAVRSAPVDDLSAEPQRLDLPAGD